MLSAIFHLLLFTGCSFPLFSLLTARYSLYAFGFLLAADCRMLCLELLLLFAFYLFLFQPVAFIAFRYSLFNVCCKRCCFTLLTFLRLRARYSLALCESKGLKLYQKKGSALDFFVSGALFKIRSVFFSTYLFCPLFLSTFVFLKGGLFFVLQPVFCLFSIFLRGPFFLKCVFLLRLSVAL